MPAARYRPKTIDPHSSHSRIVHVLEAALANRETPRVLDVGCASGLLKHAAEQHGCTVGMRAQWVGVDVDRDALDTAARRGMEVHHVDFARDEPPAGPFDAVLFADVLEHLPSPEQVLRRWLPALCDPRTLVVVSLPNVANLAIRMSLLFGHFQYAERGILDREHLRFYTRDTARRMLARAGLAIDDVWVTPVPVHLLVDDPGVLRRVAVGSQRPLYALTRLAPTLLGYQFVFAGHHDAHVD